jgi:hypothetical protein
VEADAIQALGPVQTVDVASPPHDTTEGARAVNHDHVRGLTSRVDHFIQLSGINLSAYRKPFFWHHIP